jgi:cobalt-zinc-cadmium efflux system outer membrane protein
MSRFSFVFLFLCLAIPIRAGGITAEAAVTYALRHNPELEAARQGIEQARGRLAHSGRRAAPELEAEFRPNLADSSEFGVGLGIMQKFPLTSRLLLEKKLSHSEVTVAELEVRDAERRLGVNVRLLAVKLLALNDERELKRGRLLLGREWLVVARKNAAAGEGSSLEADQLELEAGQVEVELLQLDAEEVALMGALRPLLGWPVGAALELAGTLGPPSPVDSAGPPDVTIRPDYLAGQARLESARRELDLQKASQWDDVSAGLAYERDHAYDAGAGMQRDQFLGIKLTVPLPLRSAARGRVQEAVATIRRRELEAAALAASIEADAATARAEMTAATTQYARISSTLLPQARQIEEKFFAAYQSGQAPLTNSLRSREQRLSLEAAQLAAQRNYHLARIQFEAAMGR